MIIKRKLVNQPNRRQDSSSQKAVAVEKPRRGRVAWLFGAYTFLIVWGMAVLVLLFTDRLPL